MRVTRIKAIAFGWGFAVSLGGVVFTGGLPQAYLLVFVLCSWLVRALFGFQFEHDHPALIAVLTALVHGFLFTGITSVLDVAILHYAPRRRRIVHVLSFVLYAALLLLALPYRDEPIF